MAQTDATARLRMFSRSPGRRSQALRQAADVIRIALFACPAMARLHPNRAGRPVRRATPAGGVK